MMARFCGEGNVAASFTEGVSSSAEGDFEIDGTASAVSLAPNICVVPGVSAAVREGEECVEIFVDQLSEEESAARFFILEREADDNDSFADIMSGVTAVGDVESEGWTLADALEHAIISVETLAEGVVDTSRSPACEPSFFIAH